MTLQVRRLEDKPAHADFPATLEIELPSGLQPTQQWLESLFGDENDHDIQFMLKREWVAAKNQDGIPIHDDRGQVLVMPPSQPVVLRFAMTRSMADRAGLALANRVANEVGSFLEVIAPRPISGQLRAHSSLVVESITETLFESNVTGHAVAYAAGNPTANEQMMCFFGHDEGGSAVTVTENNGGGDWSVLGEDHSDSNHVGWGYYQHLAVGDEGGTTVDFLTSASERAAAQVWRVSGNHTSTTPEAGTVNKQSSTEEPDPPDLNPAGWTTEETLWIAIATHGFRSDNTEVVIPTSYTLGAHSTNGNSGNGGRVHSAYRLLSAESENPGIFTWDSVSGASAAMSQTLAIRPAAAGGGGDPEGPLVGGKLVGGGILAGRLVG